MMKFITRALLLILGIVVLASDHFLFLPACSAADSSTNIAAPDPIAASNALRRAMVSQRIKLGEGVLLMEAAQHGDPAAQYRVGYSYAHGTGLAKSYTEAVKWFRLAAEQGYAPAQWELGLCLFAGDGVKKDSAEAFAWFSQAAAKEHIDSTYMLGRMYESGWPPAPTNKPAAILLLQKAAAYNHALAQFHLGQMYAAGQGVERDPVEALKWFLLIEPLRASVTNRSNFFKEFDAAYAALLGTMKQDEISEAKRRVAAFTPKPQPTNYSTIDFWKTNAVSAIFPGAGTGAILPAPRSVAAPPAFRNAAQMVVDVPIKIDDFRPIISASVNGGKALRFFFDAGSSVSYISEKAAAKLKLKSNAKLNVGGQLWDSVQGATLAIGGASFTPKHFAIRDSKTMQALDPFVDGLIGADLLQSFVVELDYRKGRMRLRDPAVYKYTGPGDYLFMRFERGRPYVSATVTDGAGRTLKTRLLLATVTRGSLFLERQFAETNALKESVSRSLPGKVHGVDGSEEARYGQLTGLQLGHYFFQNPPTIFLATPDGPGEISGYIGGAILSRFNLIFHSGRQQLILIPNDTFPQPTLRTDSASEMFK